MGWESSDRRARLPSDWTTRRATVLRRCGYRCEWTEDGVRCQARATDADHRIPGDDHDYANLQGLCPDHHRRKTLAEAAEGRRAFHAKRFRPRETHPSLRRY